MMPLVLEKGVSIPANMTTHITLQSKYTPTSYQTQVDFQGKTMIFVDPVDRHITFYPFVICFEAKGWILMC